MHNVQSASHYICTDNDHQTASYYYLTHQQINTYKDIKYSFELKWFYCLIKERDGKCKRVESEGAEAVQKWLSVCQQTFSCVFHCPQKIVHFKVIFCGVVLLKIWANDWKVVDLNPSRYTNPPLCSWPKWLNPGYSDKRAWHFHDLLSYCLLSWVSTKKSRDKFRKNVNKIIEYIITFK